jgi:hypothetical protein
MMRPVSASSATRGFVAEKSMIQRALPMHHPSVAPDETAGPRAPSNAPISIRAFMDRFVTLLRLLGQFAAAGGPLS